MPPRTQAVPSAPTVKQHRKTKSQSARLREPMDKSYQSVIQLRSQPDPGHIVLHLPPNIANGSAHWMVEGRIRERYKSQCSNLLKMGLVAKPPKNPPAKVHVRVTVYLKMRMDKGNLMNRLKWAEDWLVKNGYATDDSDKHWEYVSFPEQVIDRDTPRLEFWIEEKKA